MTYLVLARKWRPRSFDTLVGQDHVVRALAHALDTQRLHHAWLFTGTRGVGKTTLARILAKALNCEQGISATPCGTCPPCMEIDAGRFVDYVELDAASNRGVDDMTQLLEQAVYAPSVGRFKVYMIDEVHMLSGHAFNAMLKTLEEPPAHVKFILATTDPQKIPPTVLSRCLQFNLKQMPPDAIVGYLQTVLASEDVTFESPALHLLARAAAGSMRDALSLADQAIAYCSGNLTSAAVQEMLGTVDQAHLFTLLQGLADNHAASIVEAADGLAMRGLSYSAALADLAELLSRIAIEQRIPGATDPTDPDHEHICSLAAALTADQIQLFYAVAVHSRAELSLAPDAYAGFVMAGLRMLALLPQDATVSPGGGATPSAADAPRPESTPAVAHSRDTPSTASGVQEDDGPPDVPPVPVPPVPAPSVSASVSEVTNEQAVDQARVDQVHVDEDNVDEGQPGNGLDSMSTGQWPALVKSLPLTGAAAELARQSEWLGVDDARIRLRMGVQTLGETSARARLQTVLSEHFRRAVELDIVYAETGESTVHAMDAAQRQAWQEEAEAAVSEDPLVNQLLAEFGGQIITGSIQSLRR